MKIRYMIEFKKIFFVILMCIESQNIICSNITHYNDTSNCYVYYDTITMTERVDRRNDSLATDVYYITDTIIVKYDTTPRPYMVIYIRESNKEKHNTDSAYFITLYSVLEKEFFTVVSLKQKEDSHCSEKIKEESIYIFSLKKISPIDRAPQIGVRAKVIVEGKEIRVPIRAYDYNTYTTSNLRGICYYP